MSWLRAGCRCWVPVQGAGAGCVAGAGCSELAVRVVETGCRCWVPVPGAGAGCGRVVETRRRCWALAVRVVETAGAGAGAVSWQCVLWRLGASAASWLCAAW